MIWGENLISVIIQNYTIWVHISTFDFLYGSIFSGITKKPSEEKTKTIKGNGVESSNMKKEFKTVYDMVAHLCGKHIPGIPINNPLPADPVERAKQVYWQHSTLLTFMR